MSVRTLSSLVLALTSAAPVLVRASDFWVENRIVYNANLPHDRDGLKDDVDYFPESYLKSVADCGMNGIWMWVRWRQVANTFLTPRTADGERRIAKLRSIARKCRRHGIKLWIFGIEPASFKPGDRLPVEHPELKGAHFKSIDWSVWCPSEPQTLRYLEEAACDIFTQVPELGGFLNIANGENLSTCLDALWDSPADTWKADTRCARCAGREAWRLYADVSEAIVRGIRKAGGDQRYISWFYQPGSTPVRNPWVADCAAHAPDGVTFMYNFESGIVKDDLGRYRCGGDYWLSQPGPGTPFKELSAASATAGRRIGAKIQTCNSHEIATLPYIPVPGALYRKYRAMRACGVRDVLQGWFFGGDPSLMLKAAGDLSRGEFPSDEDAFLTRFANRTFGPDCAADAVAVWKAFSTAYGRYPLCNMMGYYGPFHAGIAWPLHADIVMAGLPQAWVPDEPPAGDMIGDCLCGYDLDEAERIAERMAAEVDGTERTLDRLAATAPAEFAKDVGIMKAFRLQVLAARDVFGFYRRRRDAIAAVEAKNLPRAEALIAGMKDVVASSRALSAAMLPLAEADNRLGFHGEASQRLYDPARLRARLEGLDRTSRRLDEIAADVKLGRAWPRAARESCHAGEDVTGDDIVWRFSENANGDLVFSGSFAASRGCVSFAFCDLAATRSTFVVRADPEKGLVSGSDFVAGTSVRKGDRVAFSFVCRAGMWGHRRELRPRGLLISAVPKENLRGAVGLWPKRPEPVACRLAIPANVPAYFGFLDRRIAQPADPVKVIFDTDMYTDFDDAGALACLHAMADAGECEILATVSNTRDCMSVAMCEIINAYYGRPDIPVGCVKGMGLDNDRSGAHDRRYGATVRKYAKWVRHLNSGDAPDAAEVYRRVLGSQPDRSVVICSVGFLTNMRKLVETDRDLVARKVKLWVAMACSYPKGKEYNSMMDWESSKIALENWPTPIVFTDFQYGMDCFAGRALAESYVKDSPVADVFRGNIPTQEEIGRDAARHLRGCNGMPGRSAWDETAVLIAVRGADRYFNVHRGTYRMVGDKGEDEWIPDEENGPHVRVTEKTNKLEVGKVIDELLCRGPIAKAK